LECGENPRFGIFLYLCTQIKKKNTKAAILAALQIGHCLLESRSLAILASCVSRADGAPSASSCKMFAASAEPICSRT
jgi:hypothetical protein